MAKNCQDWAGISCAEGCTRTLGGTEGTINIWAEFNRKGLNVKIAWTSKHANDREHGSRSTSIPFSISSGNPLSSSRAGTSNLRGWRSDGLQPRNDGLQPRSCELRLSRSRPWVEGPAIPLLSHSGWRRRQFQLSLPTPSMHPPGQTKQPQSHHNRPNPSPHGTGPPV